MGSGRVHRSAVFLGQSAALYPYILIIALRRGVFNIDAPPSFYLARPIIITEYISVVV